MATKKSTAAMDLIVESLKKNRSASYADIKAAADVKKIKGVYPIMFGRAQAMLGIVKAAKRGQGKAAKAKAQAKGPGSRGRQPDASSKSGRIRELLSSGMSAGDIAKKVGCTPALVYNVKARMSGGPRRGPGRPPKARALVGSNGSADLFAAIKNAEQRRSRMLAALERISTVLADALQP